MVNGLRQLLLATLVVPVIVDAQANSAFVHESWTVRDGLPINLTTQVMQSRSGYLWVSTFDGLARFDGVRFTVFNLGNSEGLPSNRIVQMYETRDTTLWLTTEQRQLVSFRDGRFSVVAGAHVSDPRYGGLYETHDGRLLIALDNGLFQILGNRLHAIAAGTITSASAITESADGPLWIAGKPAGLYRLRDQEATPLEGVQELSGRSVSLLTADSTGSLWIGSTDALFRYHGTSRTLTREPIDGTGFLYEVAANGEVYVSTTHGSWRLLPNGDRARIGDDGYVTIATAPDGRTWATMRPRLTYEKRAQLYLDGASIGPLPEVMNSANIVSMAIDHEGSIWYATTAEGLHRLKPALFSTFGATEGLLESNVYIVAADQSGAVWTIASGRPARIAQNAVTTFRDVQTYNPTSILEDRQGVLWLGDQRCVRPAMRCTRMQGSPIRGTVRALFEDPTGALWFGAEDGVFTLRGTNWQQVSDVGARAFASTPDGAIWMATNGRGVARFSNGNLRFYTTVNGMPGNLVRALHVDSDGILWIGTEGNGLARIDPRAMDQVRVIDHRRGLYDDGIHEILEDDHQRLWMSTNRGIFWVSRAELNDLVHGRIRQVRSTAYTERHGLANREANGGSQPAGTKTPDGRLWFATQAGVVVVDPRLVATNTVVPNVVVERVQRSGERNRDIAIDYTALSLLAPENVRFRYRLENYDGDWIDADTRRTAFYTKVPPGSYTFRVIASNDAGLWNEAGATSSFSIDPLPYETTWFKLLLLTASVALVLAVMRYRVRQVRIAAEADQLRELDRAKSRFFANVSHEFRTPLTLTIGPLEDIRAHLRGQGDAKVVSRVDLALRNAQRLFTLVSQVLDVSKLEAGSMTLQVRPGDVVGFVRAMMSSFEALASRKQIVFTLKAPDDVVLSSFDADALEKVITNLLSNAFKFTPDDGRITVSIEKTDTARIRVSDSGPGIPAKDLPHVFDRFYQVDETNSRAQVGTGIGLALARELTELLGGTIAVANNKGSAGATFTVTLPLAEITAAEPAGSSNDDVTTILIVEDSADMRAYLRARFAQQYRVIEATDGAQGIAVARDRLPDLIISDVMMPGTDGHQLVAALREDSETDFIPIILLTAAADSAQRIAGLAGGADDYVTKPFDMRELEVRVENLISSRRRLRARFAGMHVELTPESVATVTHSADDRAFLDRLNAALDARLGDPEFGVAELAAAVFMDRTHLFRRTRELLGEAPSDMLRRVRLERAARMLVDTADGVADIAYGVGFNSVSAFCRAFRDAYQATPSTFRNTRATTSQRHG